MMQTSPDYIVLGSGVAGLRAAIELARGGRVAVLTKDRLDESNTEYAQGGVAVALSDDDEISLHVEDTLKAGAGLCDEKAVRVLVAEGPRYITGLIEWGAQFDREGGELAFTQEAAHSRRRILHAHGDSTGREIVRALIAHAKRHPNIELVAHAATIGLIVADGRCAGVRFIDPNESLRRELFARAVVLATGGAGQVFAQTTNQVSADINHFMCHREISLVRRKAMRKLLKNKFLASVLVLGLTGAITGSALAGQCTQTLIYGNSQVVITCDLILEITYEDGYYECHYDCTITILN